MTYASTPLPDRHSHGRVQACDSWPPSASCCFCPVSWAVFTLTAAYTQTCNVRHRGETQHFMRCGTDTAECGLLDCDQASGDWRVLADADTRCLVLSCILTTCHVLNITRRHSVHNHKLP